MDEAVQMSVGVELRERRIATEGFYHYYRFSGHASYGRGVPGRSASGTVKGNVAGDVINLEISWDNGLTGIYNGKIGPRGKIAGSGYEKGSPSKKVSWFSDTVMLCEQVAKQPRHIRAGDFVIVKRLPNWLPLPKNVKIQDPIEDDVAVGERYLVKEFKGGEVTILTPLGKRKEYHLLESYVELAPK